MTGPGTHDGKTPIHSDVSTRYLHSIWESTALGFRLNDTTISVDWCTQTPRRFPESIRGYAIQLCKAKTASMHGSLPGFEHICVGEKWQHYSIILIILKVPSISPCFSINRRFLIHLDHRLFGTRASIQFLRAKVRATIFRSEGSELH